MGKKRIAKPAAKDLIEERQTVESRLARGDQVSVSREQREGRVYVYSSYNNTIMTVTDEKGNTLGTVSAGSIGFKGTKKSTPFAASKVADGLFQLAKGKGIQRIHVFVKGVGAGRDSALRSLGGKDLDILSIRDITPVPHNGPKPPKVRRV